MLESFSVLSKDHLGIAIDEINVITKTYDRFARAKILSNLVIIQSKVIWKQTTRRITFVKILGQILRKMLELFLDEENPQEMMEKFAMILPKRKKINILYKKG
jgi:hypothetical protein